MLLLTLEPQSLAGVWLLDPRPATRGSCWNTCAQKYSTVEPTVTPSLPFNFNVAEPFQATGPPVNPVLPSAGSPKVMPMDAPEVVRLMAVAWLPFTSAQGKTRELT